MGRWKHRFEACPHCGLVYESFKTDDGTGRPYKYADIRTLLWVGSSDYSEWKYKRRNTVLGLWHQIKKAQWAEHLYVCEIAAQHAERKKVLYELAERLPVEKDELRALLADPEFQEVLEERYGDSGLPADPESREVLFAYYSEMASYDDDVPF